ncbi:RDD family protein [Ignatzschineria rhizosphaerae]|uniref:RDD family protein n=1 Tax=Ignatzschineria rhizosphaerae TaxID=2923279 RepID=A0ABY3X018_9GAMM|nr:RDD family protein [Ignatzschineria rhizosphaerae]UNM96223.1 RDD family protein [Ignatzschineria rhizosphaerae]
MNSSYPRALLHRRMGALLYDILCITALILLVGVFFFIINGGEEITAEDVVLRQVMRVFIVLTPIAYFLFFWMRDAHTTGMRAWRLRIQRLDGTPITGTIALIRLGFAIISWIPLGLGYWWVFVSPTRLSWHDRLSGTEIIQLPKQEKKKKP